MIYWPHTPWIKLIVAGWGLLLAWSTFQANLPAGWWFDAGEISVQDSRFGQPCPEMDFRREINHEFFAEWTVTIMRQRANGGFATYATFSGANDYRPGNELPERLDLCWWTGQASLMLPKGTYRLHTLWQLDVDGGMREVRRKSLPFVVE